MAYYKIKKSLLYGEFIILASKSQTMRAILFAMLAEGKSIIHRPLLSKDSFSMIQACEHFGAKIKWMEEQLEIEGIGCRINYTEDVINAGNSGLILRLCTGIASLGHSPIVITGDASIRHQRPMKPLLDALIQLGVEVQSMRGDGFAPIIIKGPLKSGKAHLEGQDSQYISSLLIASAFSDEEIELYVTEPGEKPWVSLTMDWLQRMGASVKNENFSYYHIKGKSRCPSFHYSVPGDLSNAAFPIVAAIITRSALTLINVDLDDLQGDKEFIYCLMEMGAHIEIDKANKSLQIYPSNSLQGIDKDINDFIDAITIFAVVGCYAEGETVLRNASIARCKECNRIGAIIQELRKMGAHIEETKDGIKIKKSKLVGTKVFSHGDHRMAMSLTIAGLGADGETIVEDVECIQKTFPDFFNKFKNAGALIEELS